MLSFRPPPLRAEGEAEGGLERPLLPRDICNMYKLYILYLYIYIYIYIFNTYNLYNDILLCYDGYIIYYHVIILLLQL